MLLPFQVLNFCDNLKNYVLDKQMLRIKQPISRQFFHPDCLTCPSFKIGKSVSKIKKCPAKKNLVPHLIFDLEVICRLSPFLSHAIEN